MADDLTLSSWDAYPVSGWGRDVRGETYRMANPQDLGFVHDQMASYQGRWAQMELQPGQVNWSGVPVLLYPGAVRLWIWTAFAHGAEFVTTYRFRQPRFGIELFHHGLVGWDGTTATVGGREFVQAVDEMKRLDLSRVPAVRDELDAEGTIGIVYDHDQLWYYASLPQAKRWSQPHWLKLWHAAAARLGLKVRILHPGRAWPAGLKMVVVPGLQMVDPEWVSRMDQYAAGGGHLVLTCRTALMDRNGQAWEGDTAAPILPLIGGEIEAYDGLPEETWGQVELLDGQKHAWGVWGELLYAAPQTKVLAKYADQFYAGAAAVIQRKHGSGVVTYCGVHGEQGFVDALVEDLAEQAGIKASPLPPRVRVLRRGPYRVLLNYQDAVVQAPAPTGTKFLVGSRRVEPAGVAVWEEPSK
jgi:beta-galactosidase